MKKAFLIIALLLISFWCINVKADDDVTLPIATDPESAEIEKQEEVKEEEKKEVVKAEAKAEPTRGDADANTEYVVTINIYDTRTNKIAKTITKKTTDSGTSSQTVKSIVTGILYLYI